MSDSLTIVLDLALGVVKDMAMDDALCRVKEAQRAYLMEKAEKDRQKGNSAVKAIAELDRAAMKLKFQYDKLRTTLSPESLNVMERVFNELEEQRKDTVRKKRMRS